MSVSYSPHLKARMMTRATERESNRMLEVPIHDHTPCRHSDTCRNEAATKLQRFSTLR